MTEAETPAERRRCLARERMQRWRDRLRAGTVVAPIEVNEQAVEAPKKQRTNRLFLPDRKVGSCHEQ